METLPNKIIYNPKVPNSPRITDGYLCLVKAFATGAAPVVDPTALAAAVTVAGIALSIDQAQKLYKKLSN